MVDPLSYFSFKPVFHDWCNKGRGMCYPDFGMMHIKEPLLLIERVAQVVMARVSYGRIFIRQKKPKKKVNKLIYCFLICLP